MKNKMFPLHHSSLLSIKKEEEEEEKKNPHHMIPMIIDSNCFPFEFAHPDWLFVPPLTP